MNQMLRVSARMTVTEMTCFSPKTDVWQPMHSTSLLPPPSQGIWGGDEKAVTSKKTSNPPNSHA